MIQPKKKNVITNDRLFITKEGNKGKLVNKRTQKNLKNEKKNLG